MVTRAQFTHNEYAQILVFLNTYEIVRCISSWAFQLFSNIFQNKTLHKYWSISTISNSFRIMSKVLLNLITHSKKFKSVYTNVLVLYDWQHSIQFKIKFQNFVISRNIYCSDLCIIFVLLSCWLFLSYLMIL